MRLALLDLSYDHCYLLYDELWSYDGVALSCLLYYYRFC